MDYKRILVAELFQLIKTIDFGDDKRSERTIADKWAGLDNTDSRLAKMVLMRLEVLATL